MSTLPGLPSDAVLVLGETRPGLVKRAKRQSNHAKLNPDTKQVVVVDDEVGIADSLTEILTSHGYEARAFYSGLEAIDYCQKRCPEIVVSDVVMPKLNGVDTVLAIRQFCPDVRIVLFSGQAGTGDILAGARSKGYEFELLPKPIHPERLLRTLASSTKY